MSEINKEIDNITIQERRKKIVISSLVIVPIAFFLLFLCVQPMGTTYQTSGEVVKLIGSPGNVTDNLFLLVKLENGELIRSPINNSSFYKKGKTVSLQKQEPFLFGRTVYHFQGYINNK